MTLKARCAAGAAALCLTIIGVLVHSEHAAWVIDLLADHAADMGGAKSKPL